MDKNERETAIVRRLVGQYKGNGYYAAVAAQKNHVVLTSKK